MKVKVKNGRIVEIKGEDINGWNGRLCGKAFSGIEGRIYAPDRILHPLKRVGKRGEGKFVTCTWEELINTVAAKLKEYIDAGHPEYFEIWWGCPMQQDNIPFLYYWSTVLGSGISYLHGQVCFGDNEVEKTITFGKNHAYGLTTVGGADWPRTKYAVVTGENFPGTATAGLAMCNVPLYALASKARENGCKFVVVDPKLTDSGAWCDEWVSINPSTDAVFALSIVNVLIREKLYDEDFLLKYSNAPQLIRVDNGQALKNKEGQYLAWDALTNSAKPIPKAGERDGLSLGLGKIFRVTTEGNTVKCKTAFQMLAEETGKNDPAISCSPEKTVEIARMLGKNKPAAVLFGGSTSGRYSNWLQTLRSYSVGNILLGNLDKPGGYYFVKHVYNLGSGWPEPPEVPEYRKGKTLVPAPWGNLVSIKTIDKEPCYKQPRDFHPSTQALPWLHFNAIEQGRIRAVLSSTENSAVTQPDSKWVWECLKKLDLIVVGEQLPKEFTDLADYVIPEASYLERNHLYQFNYPGTDDKEHTVFFMRSAAIPPQGESKPISWVLKKVAKKVGLGEYFENLDLEYEWWDRMLKTAGLYPNVTSKRLVEEGPYTEEHPINYDILFAPIATRSGRFEIYSNELAEECYHNLKSMWHHDPHVNPLPTYIPIAEPKGDDQFLLIDGKATWHQKSATQGMSILMEDAIEGGCPFTSVYINTERAEKLGIKDGDLIELECVGPTKKDDPNVFNEAAIGVKERGRVKLTQGLNPKALWVYFAAAHHSKSMIPKAREGVTINWLIPYSRGPYAGECCKNYSIVKIKKVTE